MDYIPLMSHDVCMCHVAYVDTYLSSSYHTTFLMFLWIVYSSPTYHLLILDTVPFQVQTHDNI